MSMRPPDRLVHPDARPTGRGWPPCSPAVVRPGRRSPRRLPEALLPTVLAFLVVGCVDHDPAGVSREGPVPVAGSVRAVDYSSDGLEQEVRVHPSPARVGDTLRIESRVRNDGDAGVGVEARICGLDVRAGGVEPFDRRCAGWSVSRALGSGESMQLTDRRHVAVAPADGVLRLRVRHLLSPDRWLLLEVPVER